MFTPPKPLRVPEMALPGRPRLTATSPSDFANEQRSKDLHNDGRGPHDLGDRPVAHSLRPDSAAFRRRLPGGVNHDDCSPVGRVTIYHVWILPFVLKQNGGPMQKGGRCDEHRSEMLIAGLSRGTRRELPHQAIEPRVRKLREFSPLVPCPNEQLHDRSTPPPGAGSRRLFDRR